MWATAGRTIIRLGGETRRRSAYLVASTSPGIPDRGSLIGKPVWGFRVVGTKAEKSLTPDPAKLPYLRGMIERALFGSTMREIAQWLDTEAIEHPAARPRHARTWAPKSVSQILRNPSLAGRRMDDRGRVVVRHESVISAEQFAHLQAILDSSPRRRGPTRNEPAMRLVSSQRSSLIAPSEEVAS
jgi:Recombinase